MSPVISKKIKISKKTNPGNIGFKKLQSEFISSTSHQFRTPLSTIQSSVELLEFYIKKENTTRQLEIIDKIKRSIISLTDTLEKITALYKYNSLKEELNLKKFDLRKLMNELLEEVVVNISDSHLIGVNIEPELKAIRCDGFIVKQILLNLINNAVKFSPQGGQIKIDVNRNKRWIEFSVRDEGIGIAKNDLKKLFQPFFRGRNSGTIPGVGLGLAIVKNLTKMHKGQIECASKLNEGTEFKFRIRG
jgi:signal transduction histidine kinase